MGLSSRLEAQGLRCLRRAPPRLRLTPGLEAFNDWLDGELNHVQGPLVVAGRSFGGRLAVRLAARRRLSGLMLLGFPIRPPQKRRLVDEQALAAVSCPTWIAQGSHDALGPMDVLKDVVAGRSHIEIMEVTNAGHSFGAQEATVLDKAAAWVRTLALE